MSKNQTSSHARMAAICFLLLQRPHSVTTLMHDLGLPAKSSGHETSIRRCLRALKAEGLADITGLAPLQPPPSTQRKRAMLWSWLESPKYQPDLPR